MKQDLELKATELEQKGPLIHDARLMEYQNINEELKNEKETLEVRLQKLELELKTKTSSAYKTSAKCETCAKFKEENAKLLQCCAEWKNKYTRIEVEYNDLKKKSYAISAGSGFAAGASEESMRSVQEETKKQKTVSAELKEENGRLRQELSEVKEKLAFIQQQEIEEIPISEKSSRLKLPPTSPSDESAILQWKQKYDSSVEKISTLEQLLENAKNATTVTPTKPSISADPELAEKYKKLVIEHKNLLAAHDELAKKVQEFDETNESGQGLAQLKKKIEELERLNSSLLKKAGDYTKLQEMYANDTMALAKQKEELSRKLQALTRKVCINNNNWYNRNEKKDVKENIIESIEIYFDQAIFITIIMH